MSQQPGPDDQISHPVVKFASAVVVWATSLTWGERAQVAAFAYTMLLIFDWFWRRILRPWLIACDWWPKSSPYLRETAHGDLEDGPRDR